MLDRANGPPSGQPPGEPTPDRSPRVLIVDPSDDTRDVLATVLDRRGCWTCQSGDLREGLQEAGQLRPDLIVLDLEGAGQTDAQADWADRYEQQIADHGGTLILLGHLRGSDQPLPGGTPDAARSLAKPYRYAQLLRTIELALAKSPRAA